MCLIYIPTFQTGCLLQLQESNSRSGLDLCILRGCRSTNQSFLPNRVGRSEVLFSCICAIVFLSVDAGARSSSCWIHDPSKLTLQKLICSMTEGNQTRLDSLLV
jgi:hypothetical protein